MFGEQPRLIALIETKVFSTNQQSSYFERVEMVVQEETMAVQVTLC